MQPTEEGAGRGATGRRRSRPGHDEADWGVAGQIRSEEDRGGRIHSKKDRDGRIRGEESQTW